MLGTDKNKIEASNSNIFDSLHVFDFFLLILLLFCSLTLNVYQGIRIRRTPVNQSEYIAAPTLDIGAYISDLNVRDINNNDITISFGVINEYTILFLFSPTCYWCNRNMANFKAIASSQQNSYNVIGISLTDNKLLDYIEHYNIDFPVYTNMLDNTRNMLMARRVPQTLVVSSDGQVVKLWLGAYRGETKRDVEKYFNVNLPGLLTDIN